MLTETIGWPLAPGSGVAILFDCALKGTLLLLTVWVLLRLVLRRAPAAARYALCVAATGGLLALPAVSALAPRWSLPLPDRWVRLVGAGAEEKAPEASSLDLPPQPVPFPLESKDLFAPLEDGWRNNPFTALRSGEERESRTDPVFPVTDATRVSIASTEPVASSAQAVEPAPTPSRFTFRWPSVPVMLTAGWAVGALLAFLPWFVGLRALRRLLRQSRRIEDGVAVRQVEALCRSLGFPIPALYETERSLVPMAGSFFGSFILLPPDAAAWSEAKLRNVLTHEMGHIVRRDDLAYLAARLAAALHWFNPFVWALLRVLRYERERACDDLVLRQGAVSCDYATHLVEILKNASSVHPAMLAATPMACPRRLEKRIVAILDDHLNRKGLTMRNLIVTLAVVTALTLFLGGATVTRSVETKDAGSKPVEKTNTEKAPGTEETAKTEKTSVETSGQTATADPAKPTDSAAPQEFTLPEGHVSAFGKDYQYAFLSGDGSGYKAPDFDGFFPDDEEAGKKLDDLLQNDAFNRTKWMDDNEVCRMVRQGLKRFKGKNNLMSWLGNQYIWGKSPQNPDAIEIAYHLYGDPNLRDNAVYFGLSVVEPVKPPAILKAFVEIPIKDGRFSSSVHRMQWGARGQAKEVLKYIEPYLESDKNNSIAKQFKQIFSEEEGANQPQPSPEDEETRKKNQEKWKKETEERKQAFFTMSDDERRQKIRGMNFLFGPGGENVEEDNKILDILAKYTKDSDQMVREQLAGETSNMYIWSTRGEQNPKAIAIALEMVKDPDPDVRHSAIYFGLSTVRNKSEEVMQALLDVIYKDRDRENYERVAWGLRGDRAKVKKLLDADMAGFQTDPEKALRAFEIYGDMLEESPTTPDWVASMAAITGNKEAAFYLTAKDPKTRTDLPAFRTAVRDTLLKNKERGERWLKQFYLDKSYKTWNALVYVPFQDRYVFQDFIKANDTLVIQGFPGSVTPEQKAKRIENLRTPDLQPVKASDITPANVGETIKPLPAEAQAALDKKKAQLEAERKALMAPSELQLKVNAAKPGDTIRLEAKEYAGVVTIDKPLTLEGTGDRATLLSAKTFPPMEKPQETGKEIIPALLAIKGEGPVVLRNLRFKLEAQGQGSCVILVNQAKAQIVGCEIEKAPWSGIGIMDSDAEIRDCRIGNLGRNGVSIRATQGNRDKTRVLVSGCDFVECVNVGLSIGEGCDNVTVEKCRISGSSWHGIRYDDASPKIVGNLIFKNSRSGIYASGKTKATVKDNVFENDEMDGISCWFNSSDLIEGNTFVGNKRESISILGYSAPTIRYNIFANNESGISFGNTGQGDAQAENAGKPVIEANLFWENKDKNIQIPPKDPNTAKKDERGFPMIEKQELDAKSLTSDPKFIDAAGRNYGLQPDSPARAAGIGVQSHLPFAKAGTPDGTEKKL
jgi:parallel beta-helix repeat protein